MASSAAPSIMLIMTGVASTRTRPVPISRRGLLFADLHGGLAGEADGEPGEVKGVSLSRARELCGQFRT